MMLRLGTARELGSRDPYRPACARAFMG